MLSIILRPFFPIFLQKSISSSSIILASAKAIFKISLLLTPDNFFIILSTAHFKLIAVGLDAIKSSLDFFKYDKSFFSIKDKTNPYAAVTPIRGAPLTSIILIALIESLTVLKSLITN